MTKKRKITTITAMSLCVLMGAAATGLTTAVGSASAATEAQPSAVYELTGVKEGTAQKAAGEESTKYSCVANGSSIVFYNVDIQNFDMLTLTGVDSQGNTVYIAEYKAVK